MRVNNRRKQIQSIRREWEKRLKQVAQRYGRVPHNTLLEMQKKLARTNLMSGANQNCRYYTLPLSFPIDDVNAEDMKEYNNRLSLYQLTNRHPKDINGRRLEPRDVVEF